MKRTIFFAVLLLLLIPVYVVCAFQNDGSDLVQDADAAADIESDAVFSLNPEKGVVIREVSDVLQFDHDSFFPIKIVDESFSKREDAVLINVDTDSVLRTIAEYGYQDVDFFVNSDMIHDHIGKINFEREYPKNFEISADVIVRDVYPKSGGGCYLGFSEKGISYNANAAEYFFVIDGQSVMLYYKTVGSSSGRVIPIASVAEESVKIAVTHLTGHIFFWVNDVCVGQYHDGKSGNFSLSYGAVTFTGGETACCTFDNLLVRKVGAE